MLLPVVVASPDPAVSMVRDIDLSGGEDPEPESPAEAPGADAPEAVIVAHRLRGRGPRDEMRCPPIVLSALPAPGCRGALRIAGAPDDRQPGFDGGSRLPLLC
jgi:hypothetical protein